MFGVKKIETFVERAIEILFGSHDSTTSRAFTIHGCTCRGAAPIHTSGTYVEVL